MFVCKGWKLYTQRFMYQDVYIKAASGGLLRWRNLFKQNPSIAKYMKSMYLMYEHQDQSCSSLFLTQKMLALEALYISFWDISTETVWTYRVVSCLNSVRYLHLDFLKPCTAAQLIKFINSFHSLSQLHILFHSSDQILEIKNQPLSKPCKLLTFSLIYLKIDLIPAISTLLGWFVTAGFFTSNLKHLCLRLWDEDKLTSRCRGVVKLLEHCSGSLEVLTLHIDVPAPYNAGNLSKLKIVIKSFLIWLTNPLSTSSPNQACQSKETGLWM